jgi:hypothetical protein
MPKYRIQVGGKTYEVDSPRPLNAQQLQGLARQYKQKAAAESRPSIAMPKGVAQQTNVVPRRVSERTVPDYMDDIDVTSEMVGAQISKYQRGRVSRMSVDDVTRNTRQIQQDLQAGLKPITDAVGGFLGGIANYSPSIPQQIVNQVIGREKIKEGAKRELNTLAAGAAAFPTELAGSTQILTSKGATPLQRLGAAGEIVLNVGAEGIALKGAGWLARAGFKNANELVASVKYGKNTVAAQKAIQGALDSGVDEKQLVKLLGNTPEAREAVRATKQGVKWTVRVKAGQEADSTRTRANSNKPVPMTRQPEPKATAKVSNPAALPQKEGSFRILVNEEPFDLEGEALDAYNRAKSTYETKVAQAKAQADKQYGAKLEKTAGMEFSAEVRKITGTLTGKEQKAAQQQAAKLTAGKTVEVDGQQVKIVSPQPVYGKVKVEYPDGTVRTVETGQITNRGQADIGPMKGASPPAKTAETTTEKGVQKGSLSSSGASIPKRKVYRGEMSDRTYEPGGAVYFTPNKEYTRNYGDVIREAELPDDVFDWVENAEKQGKLKEWIAKRLDAIEADENASGATLRYVEDARRMLAGDTPESTASAMANLGIAEAGGDFGKYRVGTVQKRFMDENNIAVMQDIEAAGGPQDRISYAFRENPPAPKAQTAPKPEVPATPPKATPTVPQTKVSPPEADFGGMRMQDLELIAKEQGVTLPDRETMKRTWGEIQATALRNKNRIGKAVDDATLEPNPSLTAEETFIGNLKLRQVNQELDEALSKLDYEKNPAAREHWEGVVNEKLKESEALSQTLYKSNSNKGRELAFLKSQVADDFDSARLMVKAEKLSGGNLTNKTRANIAQIAAKGQREVKTFEQKMKREADLALERLRKLGIDDVTAADVAGCP